MEDDKTGIEVRGEDYQMRAEMGEMDGGQMVSVETKFDDYYMYSMDQMGS